MRTLIALAFAGSASLASAMDPGRPPDVTTPPPVPATVLPAQYVQGAGSTLGFASSYEGEAFEGRFARFQSDIAFDPATASGRFDVRIDLASANTENEERDEVLLSEEFFNASALPQARYQATRFRTLADGRFVAEGTLSLRGVTQAVPLTFRWTPGAAPKLEGTATVKRLAFNIGTGDWDDIEVLPDAVSVTTTLVLQPAR
ncbi:MAG: YceI family protein [Silanimonas sp.]